MCCSRRSSTPSSRRRHMSLRLEWRSRAEGDDTILAVEVGSNAIVKTWLADVELLTDFLNDMAGLDMVALEATTGNGVDYTQRPPQEWGDLVMSRSDAGDVLSVNPQLYWE